MGKLTGFSGVHPSKPLMRTGEGRLITPTLEPTPAPQSAYTSLLLTVERHTPFSETVTLGISLISYSPILPRTQTRLPTKNVPSSHKANMVGIEKTGKHCIS